MQLDQELGLLITLLALTTAGIFLGITQLLLKYTTTKEANV